MQLSVYSFWIIVRMHAPALFYKYIYQHTILNAHL